MKKDNIYFVSGIDTNVGKSYATGYLAKLWTKEGERVITQKLVQTGNCGYSEDIDLHRKIMGIEKTIEDKEFLTMPEIFSYPCSPHLASKIDKREINFDKIISSTNILSNRYDKVLIEGAGGLMVPLKDNYLTIDYIKDNNYPLIFVTSGKLGSINHTILSFESIKSRNIKLHTLIYNEAIPEGDEIIIKDTFEYISHYAKEMFKDIEIILLPRISITNKE